MKTIRKSRKPPEVAAQVRRILAILHKWGIHTLGDFARLDKEDVRARLGSVAVILWERASGQSIRLLKLAQPPESFVESFEFEDEVETSEPLLFILRRFLEQLSVRLNAIYLVARELTLRLEFNNRDSYMRCFAIPQPTNEVDLLFRMLHTHLEDFKSEHPIVAVSLEAVPIKPVRQQFGLFETALRDPNQLSETLARLTALLGPDRVGTPVMDETHRPDAFQLRPFAWQLEDALVEKQSSNQMRSGSALRRFRPGPEVSVLLEKNKPVHLRSASMTGVVAEESGPYASSGNWWDEKSWTRTEWDVQLRDGVLLRCHRNANGWQIDGIYD